MYPPTLLLRIRFHKRWWSTAADHLSILATFVFWIGWASPANAVEPSFSYYDDVPPIDQTELDSLQERGQEARKRLKRPEVTPTVQERPTPLPPPGADERDDVPPADLHEVDELRRAFEKIGPPPSGGTTPTTGEPAPSAPASPGASEDEQLKSFSERLSAIERTLIGSEERPGLAGLIGGYTRHNGFFLMSSNGDFFLRLPVLLQADYRSFPSGQNGTDPGVRPSTFILQRVRPMVHFRVWRYFRGYLTPDLGNGFTSNPNVQGRVQVPDAFGEWDYFSALRIRVGKFKSPIGLEMLQAPQNLSFMERSLTRNLLPNRDEGAMVWGIFQRGMFEYQLGVFNGVPNANFYQESAAVSSGKTLEARVFSRPFLTSTYSWLHGFGIGAGMSWGSVRQQSGQDPMQTETFSYTFFQYNSNVLGDGDRTRISPQVAWYVGRLGLLGQYVMSTQHLAINGTGPDHRTTHEAWSAQTSYFLTDDTATFGRVEPRQPLSFSKGQWGAWEIAVRYAQLHIDNDTFVFGLADPTINAQRTQSTTIGLNWYLNSNIRLTGNFVHSDFQGATSAYRAANHEDGLMFRTQLVF